MTGGHEPGAEHGPDQRALQSGRSWQHPSEVGLATRGRADRRRSTLIASGVVLGGVGLLLSGVVMGTMEDPASATTSTMPVERATPSIAYVRAGEGDEQTDATGLVIDDRGHVLVDAAAVAGADDVWAVCPGGELTRATVVDVHEPTDLAVLQMEDPYGAPAPLADEVPPAGARLQVVQARRDDEQATEVSALDRPRPGVVQLIDLTGAIEPEHYWAALVGPVDGAAAAAVPASATSGDLTGGMVVDRSGRVAGMVTEGGADSGGLVRVLAPADLALAAEQVLGRQR